ncbi:MULTISPECIES: hypothetical protein [Nannocystis]|uniref:Uncharacterized protein n=1 Tax=Nannocystis radixulma TaxID=2995305 RepID=A0ABT5BET1_9BACT|nr:MULTISPECIES: hypothetical protein [Nannocystis]MCY1059665.1 hypothetical protein [Nannocystis sp. SCPEA4]MDC0672654.1 hypothetical protein [Nannocystis radixulma]
MKTVVRIGALYNASALVVFVTPGLMPALGVPLPSPFWVWLPGLLSLFYAIVLWLSAADLRRYGSFPFYSGIIRLVFAALTFTLDFPGTAGRITALLGAIDLVLGLACVVGIPRASGRTPLQLLTNRGAD